MSSPMSAFNVVFNSPRRHHQPDADSYAVTEESTSSVSRSRAWSRSQSSLTNSPSLDAFERNPPLINEGDSKRILIEEAAKLREVWKGCEIILSPNGHYMPVAEHDKNDTRPEIWMQSEKDESKSWRAVSKEHDYKQYGLKKIDGVWVDSRLKFNASSPTCNSRTCVIL